MRALTPLLALVLLPGLPLSAQAGPLNDTGIDLCGAYPSGNTAAPCTPTPAGQDRQYGRDAAAEAGVLYKVGGGSKGFDFTRVCNSGEHANSGACPANPALGSGANEWGCTYDNNTGLMWEVKVDNAAHLRHQSHTYSWYDSVHNYGGNAGTPDGGSCAGGSGCDTEKFVADVNAVSLCGHNDWRMPTLPELHNLVDRGIASPGPTIDTSYFPNTPGEHYWSASPSAVNTASTWHVNFDSGDGGQASRAASLHVRLVRTGP